MLFNSYVFIFLFLPLTFVLYFLLNRTKLTLAAKSWLVLASLFFYGWWNPIYLPLILGSIFFNYGIGAILIRQRHKPPHYLRLIIILGIAGNLGLLGYFKYADFFISNISQLTSWQLRLLQIVLPLGISFFTFTQIAYLVDTYKGLVAEYSLVNYILFVTFFPHLLAGPIIHHSEMMPQFDRLRNKVINYHNLSAGMFLFAIGLFKKVMIADSFAPMANRGFESASLLHFFDAWATSLSYTVQLYFDFSGYTDMALGASLMFNIKLPINFNSPYKSLNIREFWRRWHITLSRFLRDYVYIPLGGNRKSEGRVLANLLTTFFLGGLWHGAGWTFVFWGALHGLAIVVHRLWQRTNLKMTNWLAWLLTFSFVNVSWVFFRAKTLEDAVNIVKGMVGLNGFVLPLKMTEKFSFLTHYRVTFGHMESGLTVFCSLAVFIAISIFYFNSNQLVERFKPSFRTMAFTALLFISSILNITDLPSEFIYFNF